MARIKIECSEEDKKEILDSFIRSCPFMPATNECGEDARCGECIKNNTEFILRV